MIGGNSRYQGLGTEPLYQHASHALNIRRRRTTLAVTIPIVRTGFV